MNNPHFWGNSEFSFSLEISALGFSTSRKKTCQQIFSVEKKLVHITISANKIAAKLTCAKRRKIVKENGRQIFLRKENKKKKTQNGVWTPPVHKEDDKGLNEPQTTIFSPITLVVNWSCSPFVLHMYGLYGLNITESETYLKFLRWSEFTNVSQCPDPMQSKLDLHFCAILCWRCSLLIDLNFVREKCGLWKKATKLP